MNRSELIAAVSERAEVTRKDADAVIAAFADIVGDVVAKGIEKVTIPGFLSFERTHRAERSARNPQTGEPITIPPATASRSPQAPSSRMRPGPTPEPGRQEAGGNVNFPPASSALSVISI